MTNAASDDSVPGLSKDRKAWDGYVFMMQSPTFFATSTLWRLL